MPSKAETTMVETTASTAANNTGMSNMPVGENEPEYDLNINTDRSTGTSVSQGEFEIVNSTNLSMPQKVSSEYSGFLVEFLVI